MITIIIVTWNSEKDIAECLDSLLQQDYPHYKIVVVDNNSADSTTKLIKQNYPQVTLFECSRNNYFTKGNNIGINFALKNLAPKYIALLNPDTVVEPNWLSTQLSVIQSDPAIGIVTPKVRFYKDGKINSTGLVFDGFMQAYDRGIGEEDNGQYDKQEEVAAASGTSMFFRAELLQKLGGFWQPLKMYLEDLELCIRVKNHGYKIIYTPKTVVRHKYMHSTKQNPKVLEWKSRNWLLIAFRHYPWRSKLAMLRLFLLETIKKVKTAR